MKKTYPINIRINTLDALFSEWDPNTFCKRDLDTDARHLQMEYSCLKLKTYLQFLQLGVGAG
jgi:hypothetical protein